VTATAGPRMGRHHRRPRSVPGPTDSASRSTDVSTGAVLMVGLMLTPQTPSPGYSLPGAAHLTRLPVRSPGSPLRASVDLPDPAAPDGHM
jgi:hypothetical protein